MADKTGRPPVTAKEKDLFLHKLEPYLKCGVSLHKACLQAKLPASTVYKVTKEDEGFMEKIEAFKGFQAVMVEDIVMTELAKMYLDQTEGIKLTSPNYKLLMWLVEKKTNITNQFTYEDKIEKLGVEGLKGILRIAEGLTNGVLEFSDAEEPLVS